jgi:hypothetical protein
MAVPAAPLSSIRNHRHCAHAAHVRARVQAPGYERHRPEQTVLYRVVEQHWPAFRGRADEAGGLPRFVVREMEEFLRCGRPEFGCLRLGCDESGFERLVAWSCKTRGFCPSCLGRRMNDLACHLVERVIPEVPVRQWVCSLPFRLRYLCGYDRKLCADVLGAFVGELRRSFYATADGGRTSLAGLLARCLTSHAVARLLSVSPPLCSATRRVTKLMCHPRPPRSC